MKTVTAKISITVKFDIDSQRRGPPFIKTFLDFEEKMEDCARQIAKKLSTERCLISVIKV